MTAVLSSVSFWESLSASGGPGGGEHDFSANRGGPAPTSVTIRRNTGVTSAKCSNISGPREADDGSAAMYGTAHEPDPLRRPPRPRPAPLLRGEGRRPRPRRPRAR